MDDKTKTLQSEFEVSLAISDYDSRDDCKDDFEAAIEQAKQELIEAGVPRESILELYFDAEFIEFDSPNDSHGNAMFMAKFHGPEALVITATIMYELWISDDHPAEHIAKRIIEVCNNEVKY